MENFVYLKKSLPHHHKDAESEPHFFHVKVFKVNIYSIKKALRCLCTCACCIFGIYIQELLLYYGSEKSDQIPVSYVD